MAEHDEHRINNRFEPYGFYSIAQMIAMAKQTRIENTKNKNKTYYRYKKNLEENNIMNLKKALIQLNIEIDNDRAMINQYLIEQQGIEELESPSMEVWSPDMIGILSYEEE